MRNDLAAIFRAAVAACHPARVLPEHLPEPPPGRTLVLGIGKAAVEMARVVESRWRGPLEGVAVVPHGTGGALERIERVEAGHPVPDEASVAAAARLLALAQSAEADDLVLVLLSGGASALACLPGEGLSLEGKQAVTRALLRSGAPIAEVNCARRHLSRIKGGRLAEAAAPARLLTLAISDVMGNAPESIGSGPTVADPTTRADARQILQRYGIDDPGAGWSETAKGSRGEYRIVASAADAVNAAAAEARRLGYEPIELGQCAGEAQEIGADHAARALAAPPGAALISGGELTVTMRGGGEGGPNQEYALAAAIALAGRDGIAGLAADTDGADGGSEAAGAFFDGRSIARSRRDPAEALAQNDSGGFFAEIGDLFVTGPTGTNVNDLRVMLTETG